MKKAHNSNNSNKLKLNKFKIAKLENIISIKGGQANFDDDDSLTWFTKEQDAIL